MFNSKNPHRSWLILGVILTLGLIIFLALVLIGAAFAIYRSAGMPFAPATPTATITAYRKLTLPAGWY